VLQIETYSIDFAITQLAPRPGSARYTPPRSFTNPALVNGLASADEAGAGASPLLYRVNMIRQASAVVVVLVLNATPVFAQGAATASAELRVRATAADVHKFPSVASPVIGKATGGTVLEVRRNLGSWVEVPWPSAEGGIAFLHVNTGTVAPRTPSVDSLSAQSAVSEITAVAAAATPTSRSSSSSGQALPARPARSTYVSLPSHRLGMGASMNTSNPYFGATGRAWLDNRLGVQFTMGRTQLENADGLSVSSMQYAPTALVWLKDGVTNALWLRPYVGAGPRFYHSNQETHTGLEALGGAEATFSAMPQFAISAELGYRWLRPSFDGFQPRQVGFSLAGHWYLR
jgi:hypothetical protein